MDSLMKNVFFKFACTGLCIFKTCLCDSGRDKFGHHLFHVNNRTIEVWLETLLEQTINYLLIQSTSNKSDIPNWDRSTYIQNYFKGFLLRDSISCRCLSNRSLLRWTEALKPWCFLVSKTWEDGRVWLKSREFTVWLYYGFPVELISMDPWNYIHNTFMFFLYILFRFSFLAYAS